MIRFFFLNFNFKTKNKIKQIKQYKNKLKSSQNSKSNPSLDKSILKTGTQNNKTKNIIKINTIFG